jgi:bifunctional non-homologous end joining protein LigD
MNASTPKPQEDSSRLPRFVVQKHWARTLHYDFRLEINGRLVSWAVPKGPSRDPKIRRLAIRMPDHPLDYAVFEGTIPSGEYGAGAVMVWDTGPYEPLPPARISPDQWLDQGFLKFILHGHKLRGLWEMVRYRKGAIAKESWLWVKLHDRFVEPGYDPETDPLSALSGRSLEEIRGSEGVPPPSSRERPLEAWAQPCTEDPLHVGKESDLSSIGTNE